MIHVCRYSEQAEELGVVPEALYAALLVDAEIEPEDWRFMGRQANAWKKYGECDLLQLSSLFYFSSDCGNMML